jgi:thiamine kinase-like enzyme
LGNSIFIEMAYIRGEPLSRAWRTLTSDQKRTIFADIKQYVSILRQLPPPKEDLVSSAFQNPARDARVGSRFFGPMNQREFHSLLRSNLIMEEVTRFFGKEAEKLHTSTYRTHFTHADLAPRNIIVRNGRVAAIIDWAYAGWYPEYWEFTKAHYTWFTHEDYFDYLRSALPCYDDELVAEQAISSRIEEPGSQATWYDGKGGSSENPGSFPSAAWLEARASLQLKDLWSLERRDLFERT